MEDCLFCKIGRGDIPADIVFEDEDFVAFRDIDPQAPVHILVIPRDHVANAAVLADADPVAVGRLVAVSGELAGRMDIADSGYRLVFNTGREGGQSVDHAHLHLLGGRQLMWPPG